MTSNNATKRKMFIIATCIFMVTMSTVLFLVKENKLDISHDTKTSILHIKNDGQTKNESFFRELVNNDKDDLLFLKNDTSIAFSSTKLMETLGYTLEEIKEKTFFSIVHPKDLPELGNLFIEKYKENIGPVRLQAATGSYIPYIIGMKSVEDDSGDKISTALILKDTSQAVGETEETISEPEAVVPEVVVPEVLIPEVLIPEVLIPEVITQKPTQTVVLEEEISQEDSQEDSVEVQEIPKENENIDPSSNEEEPVVIEPIKTDKRGNIIAEDKKPVKDIRETRNNRDDIIKSNSKIDHKDIRETKNDSKDVRPTKKNKSSKK